MQKKNQTWQNVSARNSKYGKTYGLNSQKTTVSHLASHDFTPRQMIGQIQQKSKIIVTMSTYDCDFIILQNFFETKRIIGDLEFVQLLRVKSNYPILHCYLEYQFIETHFKFNLIGYLIDIYSNIYTLNITKALEINQKYQNHPIQFSRLFQNYIGVQPVEKLYLQTPLMIKKDNMNIITVNLKGQIKYLDFNQSKSWINSSNLQIQRYSLNNKALAANYNHSKCKKYQSVILVAVQNNRAPYVFINCSNLAEIQNQKHAQDKYQWMEDEAQITYCSIDPQTNSVVVSTVTQNISIYQIVPVKQNMTTFYYLKKKFAFFVANNINFSNLDLNFNIESIYAGKGLLLIITSKEYILFDLVQRIVRKRGKSSQINMLKWGEIVDRNENLVAVYIVKGYNHINQAQSKIGKPNLHFKTLDINKKDKNS